MYKVLSLFSGIGGWERGCEIAECDRIFKVSQFVEKNEYCQKVLAKHYPNVLIWGDVRSFDAEPGSFDCIVASPPCQSFSLAGKRKAGADERDMFPEFFRLLRTIRPRWALVENVVGLLNADDRRYFRGILWQFSQMGMFVEWGVVSATEVGAVHKRERIWIIAHTKSAGRNPSGCDNLQTRTDVALISCGDATRRETALKPRLRRENARLPRELDGNLMRHQDLPEWLPLATDSDTIPFRKERLMALGNAVVPVQAAIAWKRLAQIAEVEV